MLTPIRAVLLRSQHLFIVIPGESRRVIPGIQNRFDPEAFSMDSRANGNDDTVNYPLATMKSPYNSGVFRFTQ